MDCMDCHNRPSHIFRSPEVAINEAMLTREIDAAIPGIKAQAVEAMAAEYATKDEAMREIATRITDGYRKDRPEDYAKYQVEIDRAVVATQNAYSQNIFPAMKANWAAYPVNIGHFTSPGCMRCHDGNHASRRGRRADPRLHRLPHHPHPGQRRARRRRGHPGRPPLRAPGGHRRRVAVDRLLRVPHRRPALR